MKRLAVLAWLLFAAPAAGQPAVLAGQPPTRGPELPAGVLAGDADATAVVLDAANLAFLRSWNGVGALSWASNAAPRGPSGGGLYLASPLPLIGRVAVGAGIELFRPGREFSFGDGAKLSLALGARVLTSLSLGLTYAHVFLGVLGDVDTLDLSAAARLGRWAAFSLVVHDLPAPLFQGVPLQRVYQPELLIRPLGNYRFELALSARVGERRGDIDPTVRVQFVPTPGLTVRGSVEYLRDLDGDGHPDHAVRGTVGLQLDTGLFGTAAYAMAGTRGDGTGTGQFQGLAFTARVSGDRYAALWRPRRFERVELSGKATSSRQLPLLLDHLRRLAADPRTDGIVALIGDLDGSWATMEELRGAFRRLRSAGKHVVVFSAELSTKGYYAAAAAEKIYLDPGGGLRFVGLHTQTLYFKGTLDKLGVRADFVRIAEYKSAPEAVTRSGPSDEARLVRAALLDDVDARLIAAIAADRHLEATRVRALRDGGPYTAAAAAQAGLVDEARSGEEVELALARMLGVPRVEVVARDGRRRRSGSLAPPAVAVVFIDGDIVEGKSRVLPFPLPILGNRVAGHESVLAAIAAARADDRVRAIVVRIDSPGGNALASDLIARELLRTRGVKPVICSLGDIAASGGYFAAVGCDTIVAAPSTITGSIGIFTGKFDLSGLLAKIGITVEEGTRGAHAGLDSWFHAYSDEERALVLDRLGYYYGRFVDTVARGRALPREAVEALARGRVWSGAQALERKLVDVNGDFLDALALASQRGGCAGDADIELVSLPDEPTTLLGQLLQLLGVRAQAQIGSGGEALDVPLALAALLRAVPASLLLAPSAPQARLDFELVF